MMVLHFYGIELEEVSSINAVCQCCIILTNVTQTLTAYELGKAMSYSQAFFDETTRRQILFTSSSTVYEENIVNVSPCIFCKDSTSKIQIEGIIDKCNPLQQRLTQWDEMHK
eukprot:14093821-Ditylum_brightwellii.AAC.1